MQKKKKKKSRDTILLLFKLFLFSINYSLGFAEQHHQTSNMTILNVSALISSKSGTISHLAFKYRQEGMEVK